MTWIFLAVGAQLINAIVAILDKYIVSDTGHMPRPFVYAFYTCLLSGSWIIIFSLGFLPISLPGVTLPSFSNIKAPTLDVIGLAFFASYTFFMALVSMFTALKEADASDVIPVVGAISALSSFSLGYFLLDVHLSPNFVWGIALLATGTFLASRLQFPWKVAMNALHGGIFFGLYYIAIKGLFNMTSFDNGFFWSRIAFVLFALSLLLVPSYFEKIREQTKTTRKSTGLLVLGNKILAGVGTLLILKATDLGDVAVVQALGGLQFVFILVIGILFARLIPESCGEEGCRDDRVIQKVIFVAIIAIGFLILFR